MENNTQAYNRYSYALNNPLLPPLGAGGYTDPTGYLNDIQPETFDPDDDYNGRGGTGGSTGGQSAEFWSILNTLWAQTPWGTDIKYTNEGRDGNDYQFTAYQVVYSPNKGQFGTWENLNYFGTNGLNVTSKWIPAKAAMMPAAASATTITSPTSWGVTSLWEEAGALGRSIWSTLAGAGATATVIIGSLSIPSSERVTDRPDDVALPTHGNDLLNTDKHIVYEIYGMRNGMIETIKYGISNFDRYKFIRPQSQITPLSCDFEVINAGFTDLKWRVVEYTPDRISALSIEYTNVQAYWITHNFNNPIKNRRPIINPFEP